jgi:hypothetical protein
MRASFEGNGSGGHAAIETALPGFNREDAERFLDTLAGRPGAVFQFRIIPERPSIKARPEGSGAKDKRGTLAECWSWLTKHNAEGWAVYVVVNETLGKADKDVQKVRAFFADYDEVLGDKAQFDERMKTRLSTNRPDRRCIDGLSGQRG